MGEDWVSRCDDDIMCEEVGEDARIGDDDKGEGRDGRKGEDAKAGIIGKRSGDPLPAPKTGGITMVANMLAAGG